MAPRYVTTVILGYKMLKTLLLGQLTLKQPWPLLDHEEMCTPLLILQNLQSGVILYLPVVFGTNVKAFLQAI